MGSEIVEASVIVRQEHLQKVAPFCRALAEALRQAGMGLEQSGTVFAGSVSGECVTCGITVSGQELFALSQPPSAELAGVKIGRLRRGYCAREGCDSCYYTLSLQPHPKVGWPKILSGLGLCASESPARELRQGGGGGSWRPRISFRILRPFLLVLLGTVLLWGLRQWYMGGRIPLVREPEKFRVDPAPVEEHHPLPTTD